MPPAIDTDVSVYEGGIVTDGKNVYLRSSDGTGGQIENSSTLPSSPE